MRKIRRIVLYVLPILLLGISGQKETRAGETEEPYISSIEPMAGAPRIIVTIHGRNFNKIVIIRDVKFGWNSADTLEWTDNKIVVRVPYGKGTVKVRAEGPTGHSNSVDFRYMEPVIDSISPSVGQPGSEVTIKGRYFGFKHRSPSFYVKFGKSLATVQVNSWIDEQIIVKAPSDYGTGENDARIIKWLLKVAWAGYTGDIPGLIKDIVAELVTQGVRIPPGQGKIEVDVRVTTPAGESNAVVFTYQLEPIVEPITWKDYRIGDLSYSIPSDWKIGPQAGGGISRMYYTDRGQTSFTVGVIDAPETVKGLQSGQINITHYGSRTNEGEVKEFGTTSRSISIWHLGRLVDSFKTEIAGLPVTVCILRLTEREGRQIKGKEAMNWSFALIKGGKHYGFVLISTDREFQKAIFKQLVSRIRFFR